MRALALLLLAATACASDVEEHLSDGRDALADCDIRAAHAAFSEAYDADSADTRAALGFALTDLALLPEDPAVTAVLADLGFTGALDMQALAFGPDGALARYARGDSCDSIDAFFEQTIPYPPVADSSIDAMSLIRDDMTLGDLVSGARQLEPRLERIAEALSTAAQIDEPVELEGGCGLGQVTLQAPELHALAALIEALRSATALASAYDWEINLVLAASATSAEIPALVDSLEQHLGHRVDASAADPAAGRMGAAFDHLSAAASAAGAIDAPVENGLLDWSQLPASVADETARFFDSASASTRGAADIAGVDPVMTIDASVLLGAGVDLGAATSPIFGVGVDEFGNNFVSVDGEALAGAFTAVVDPAPWSELAPAYSWQLATELEGFDSSPITDPARRYTDVYRCMADTL